MTLPMCCSQESDPEAAEGGRLAAESDPEKVIAILTQTEIDLSADYD